MAKEITFENGQISNFDLRLGHTAYRHHHSSTATYMPNLFEIKGTFCGRTDVRTYVRTYLRTDGWMNTEDRLY